MSNPIVRVNVNLIVAPTPDTLQRTGAFISQGATNLAAGTYSLLTAFSDLAPLLLAPIVLASLAWSGGVATATCADVGVGTGSYNGTTGLVTLTGTGPLGLVPGDPVYVASLAGTGAFASAEGIFTCAAGTTGDVVTYFIAKALTMTISSATGNIYATHGASNGDTFLTTISGATPVDYNVTVLATATSPTAFTYPLASDGGTTPATGAPAFTVRNQVELISMATTFFGQGANTAVYVLELGPGEVAAGVAALSTFINAQAQIFYAYLVPRNWDAAASFMTLMASYEAPNTKTYFYITTTTATYTDYTDLMKCAFLQVEAPGIPLTEFSCAADFYVLLHYRPSSTNKVTPFEYSFVFGVTPYPTKGNGALLTELSAANVSYIGTGAEGGISDAIIFGGNYADGNPVNFWYSVDWAQINTNLFVSNAVINGSNDPTNPLYYDQQGINRLETVAAAVMRNGITYGLVLNPVVQVELDADAFAQALDAGTYANLTVVNAIPFVDYVTENPSDYKIGLYEGFTIAYTPLRGFDQIIFNLDASNFG